MIEILSNIARAVAIATLLGAAACSDPSDPETDSRPPGDSAIVDGERADAPGDQGGGDGARPDGPKGADGGGGVAASCKPIITHCAASKLAASIVPFTQSSCEKILACTKALYKGDCQTTLKDALACYATLSAPADCDTKCAKHTGTLQTYCACPKSCGVPCP